MVGWKSSGRTQRVSFVVSVPVRRSETVCILALDAIREINLIIRKMVTSEKHFARQVIEGKKCGTFSCVQEGMVFQPTAV